MTADETSAGETTEKEDTVKARDEVDAPHVEESADSQRESGWPSRGITWIKTRSSGQILPAVTVLLMVASLSLCGLLYWNSYRPDRATDAAAAKVAIAAASEGVVAVLSYSPDTLDHDFSAAKSHLTGDFLSYYEQFTQQIVAPAARQKSVKTTAVILRAALSEFHPDKAVVLLFVNQSTKSGDRPEPALSSNSVLVSLTKVNDKWLISSFNPV